MLTDRAFANLGEPLLAQLAHLVLHSSRDRQRMTGKQSNRTGAGGVYVIVHVLVAGFTPAAVLATVILLVTIPA